MSDPVVTRFAPSPTGFLHIGGARTALFNWLYARKHGGTMLLRIEDTDRERSTEPAIAAIIEGLTWLGLDWHGDVIYQSRRADRHREAVEQLLAQDRAYRCFATAAELEAMREQARAEGRPPRYDGRWRDRDPGDAPPGARPAIRLRAPQEGQTIIHDKVQGTVTWANKDLDDLVLLRSDGTPTYMLAVVVDDHDMGVTQIIRGDDHLTNAARQTQIYEALGWPVPAMAHIPLIHGADGAKLSKRHGALGVDAYRAMGYLPAALRNYLVRLGWSQGDRETFSTEEMIEAFSLEGVGRSPARFDFAKLTNLNGQYLRGGGRCRPHPDLPRHPALPARKRSRAGQADADLPRQAARGDAGAEGARQITRRTPGRRGLPVRRPADRLRRQGIRSPGAGRPRPSRSAAPRPRRARHLDGGHDRGGRARLCGGDRHQARPGGAAAARRADRPPHLAGHLRRAGGAGAGREPRAHRRRPRCRPFITAMSTTWPLLLLAIVCEAIATSALAASNGMARLMPTLIAVVGYSASFYLLSQTLREMPTGIVYAIWSGLGIVLITGFAWIWARQPLDGAALLGLGLILAGVLVINLFSTAVRH